MPVAANLPHQIKPFTQTVFEVGASTISGSAGGAVLGGEIFGLYGAIGGAIVGGLVNGWISGVSASKEDRGAGSGR